MHKVHVFWEGTKIDKVFTVNLTVCSNRQIDGEDFVSFCGLHRKHELDQPTFITFPNLSIILNYNFDFEVVGSKTFYLQTLQPEIIWPKILIKQGLSLNI